MICDVCTKEFTPKRKTAKFCSPKCRVYAARNKAIAPVIVQKKDGTTVVFGNSVEKITKAISKMDSFDKFKNGLCKEHEIALDSRGKCLQKGCKYA